MNLKEALTMSFEGDPYYDPFVAVEALLLVQADHNKQQQEILSLQRQLAHEKLRADTGWQRWEAANRAHMAALNVVAACAAKGA